MIEHLPMWNVYLDDSKGENDRLRFRVSDSDLDSFIRSIRFNNWIDGLTIERENNSFINDISDDPDEYDDDNDGDENDSITERFEFEFESDNKPDDKKSYYDSNSLLKTCYCTLGKNDPECCINRAKDSFNYGPFKIFIIDG